MSTETVQLKKSRVLMAFKGASTDQQKLLKDLVGDQVDFNQKITDRIKTFQDACEALGINPESALPDDDFGLREDNKAVIAFAKLSIIRRALNEGWTPNWENSSEMKYYPWFKFHPGSGVAFHACGAGTTSLVGSRLCFKSRELAEYAGKQFEAIYRDFLTL